MRYLFFILVGIFHPLQQGRAYPSSCAHHKTSTHCFSVNAGSIADSGTEIPPEVSVRFINTVSGKDVVTKVPLGTNLLIAGMIVFLVMHAAFPHSFFDFIQNR